MTDERDESSAPESPESPERMELPSWNRSRSKRKANVRAEAEEDAFQRGMKEAGRQAIQRSRMVVIGMVGAVAAIALGVFLMTESNQGREAASEQFARLSAIEARAQINADAPDTGLRPPTQPTFADEAERESSMDELIANLKDSSPTEIQALAQLVDARRSLRNKEFEKALKEYDEALSKMSAEHELHFLAVEGKALSQEALGDSEASLKTLSAIEQDGHFYRDVALWHRARILLAQSEKADDSGKKDEAVSALKTIVKDFSSDRSSVYEQARKRLEEIAPVALDEASKSEGEDAGAKADSNNSEEK